LEDDFQRYLLALKIEEDIGIKTKQALQKILEHAVQNALDRVSNKEALTKDLQNVFCVQTPNDPSSRTSGHTSSQSSRSFNESEAPHRQLPSDGTGTSMKTQVMSLLGSLKTTTYLSVIANSSELHFTTVQKWTLPVAVLVFCVLLFQVFSMQTRHIFVLR
jgi:hypothetical protein